MGILGEKELRQELRQELKEINKEMSKLILSLDFDGVLHSYSSGWQGADFIPDPPVPGAIPFLLEAMNNFDVKIYSSRSNQEGGIKAMMNWIKYWAKKELELEVANNLTNRLFEKDTFSLVEVYKHFPKYKPSSFVTLDDRAITFNGTFPSMQELKDFKPWNKKEKVNE